jgi:hypothetical protein
MTFVASIESGSLVRTVTVAARGPTAVGMKPTVKVAEVPAGITPLQPGCVTHTTGNSAGTDEVTAV